MLVPWRGYSIPEADLEGAQRARAPLLQSFVVFFEELLTDFIEVKLIINNAPLTYIYLNTIKTYLTPSHLLFGRQLLCYSNTPSAVIRNLTVLSSTTGKINRWWWLSSWRTDSSRDQNRHPPNSYFHRSNSQKSRKNDFLSAARFLAYVTKINVMAKAMTWLALTSWLVI